MFDLLTAAGRFLADGLLHLLYPNVCWVCGRALPADRTAFCAACRLALTADSPWLCPRCSSAVGPHANVQGGCPQCRDIKFAFDRVIRLGPYEGMLRDVVL